MKDEKKKNKSEEHANNSFWSSVEEIAKNIIKVVKDTLHIIKNAK